MVVDDHAAAGGHGEPGGAAELVAGADAGREHHQIDRDGPAVVEVDHPLPAGLLDAGRARAGVDVEAQRLDLPPEERRPRLVELPGQEPARGLHHVHLEPQLLHRARRLQPQEPAADHRGARVSPGVLADGAQIVDRAVDEHAGQIRARDGRHEGPRPRREHQAIEGDGGAGGRAHHALVAIDARHRIAEAEVDAGVAIPGLGGEAEVLLGPPGEELGEVDPIVGRARLLAEDDQAQRPRRCPAVDELPAEPEAHHSVSDDDERLSVDNIAIHAHPPCGWSARRRSGAPC